MGPAIILIDKGQVARRGAEIAGLIDTKNAKNTRRESWLSSIKIMVSKVARMQRSGIREFQRKNIPDSVSLHPGYGAMVYRQGARLAKGFDQLAFKEYWISLRPQRLCEKYKCCKYSGLFGLD